ncbi:MAG TPA: indolepyruvate oxidoreductase subunit beta [Planctomycetota bacterium]|nr:indolepyruvate oxidoreductase subunit beta [Planctomycetota bacterium]
MTRERPTTNVFLVGVGGQGIVLVSRILGELAFAAGLDVKQNEVHGLSQRGGSVTGHVRWGAEVHAPVIMEGEAHYLFALEELEALRWAHFLRPDGLALVSSQRIPPVSVTVGGESYPEDVVERLTGFGRTLAVPAYQAATELGNTRVANIVLLGAMSTECAEFSEEQWKAAVAACVPAKHRELNLKAFDRGRAAAAAAGVLPRRADA